MNERRVLLVVTSHDDLGGTGPTGYYVGEAAHPWRVFTDAGIGVDVASIAGGTPPRDGFEPDDAVQVDFLADPHVADQLADTVALADVDPGRYDAVYFVGGHGTMWDFPGDPAVTAVGRQIYESGGVVAAVCHGPAALVELTLSDGSRLVAGRRVAGFTNEEEAAVGLTAVVPFSLADRLEASGATHVPAAPWSENVVVDGRLATGQNPQSAGALAIAVVGVLEGLAV